MKISWELNQKIIKKVVDEIMNEWPDCKDPKTLRVLLRDAAGLAIGDFINMQLELDKEVLK